MMQSDHKCLRSLPRLIRRTCLCSATPLRRHPPVPFAKNFHHSRNLRNPQQRPSPPDLACQRHCCVCSAILAPITQQQTHLHHQIVARHSQQRPHACILQRRQRHSSPLQIWSQPPRKSRAEPKLHVEEQPPSGVPPLPIRVFTHYFYQRHAVHPSLHSFPTRRSTNSSRRI